MYEDSISILKGSEVPIDGLADKRVLLVGYGNQGTAHAKNMRDSGIDVSICTRQKSIPLNDGFEVASIEDVGLYDLIILALPDDIQPEFITRKIIPNPGL